VTTAQVFRFAHVKQSITEMKPAELAAADTIEMEKTALKILHVKLIHVTSAEIATTPQEFPSAHVKRSITATKPAELAALVIIEMKTATVP